MYLSVSISSALRHSSTSLIISILLLSFPIDNTLFISRSELKISKVNSTALHRLKIWVNVESMLGQRAKKIPASPYFTRVCGVVLLFKLNRCRRLTSAVIQYSVYMLHFIHDSTGYFSKHLPRNLGCFCSHEVNGVHCS